MLSNDQMHQLGRFTFLMRKVHKQSIQINRFLKDAAYQHQMLTLAAKVTDDTDDELLVLSLVLSFGFGQAV